MAHRAAIAALALASLSSAGQLPLQAPIDTPSASDSPISDNGIFDLPPVDSEALQARISSTSLGKHASALYEIAKRSEDEYGHPTRVIGSEGHKGTLKYIIDSLSKLGSYYNVSTQDFPAITGNVFQSRLVVGAEVPKHVAAMSLTPATKNREPVHGDLVLVSNVGCEASDYPAEAEGNIVLIKRGECSFGDKSVQAGKAGAIAAVVYNTDPEVLHGTLGTPSPDHVATFGLGGEEGEKYAKELKDGKTLDTIAYIDAIVETIKTTNILAQTAAGDPDNCVMLGGHSDSVEEGPGINDDGSGSISVLEVAKQLTAFSVNNCVRFAWWAAEEEGLLGSDFYSTHLSPEENKKVRLFMDYDMMGSPNYAYQVYNATNDGSPVGSAELKDLYIDWYVSKGLNYTLIPFDGRSDYYGFLRVGIPAGGVATGAEGVKTEEEEKMFGGKAGDWFDPCYHQLCDDVSNVNMTAWEINTKLIAHSVATYALSFEGFPKRTDDVEISAQTLNAKYRGHKLIM